MIENTEALYKRLAIHYIEVKSVIGTPSKDLVEMHGWTAHRTRGMAFIHQRLNITAWYLLPCLQFCALCHHG